MGLPCAPGSSRLPRPAASLLPRETEARLPRGRATAETAVPQGAAGSAPPTSSRGAAWGPRPPGPGLTQAQQHRAHLSQAAAPGRRGALGRVPGETGAQQPRVHELPAERLGLGYQLLLGGRAVKSIHDLRGENRGAPQHLHGGDAGGGSRTCGQTALSPVWLAKGVAEPARRAGSGARDGERCAPRLRPRPGPERTERPGGARLGEKAAASCGYPFVSVPQVFKNTKSHSFRFRIKSQRSPRLPGTGRTAANGDLLWGRRARARRRVRRRGSPPNLLPTSDSWDPDPAPHSTPRGPQCLSPAWPFPWRGRQGRDSALALLTSPAACRGHGGRGGALASGSARRRLCGSRSLHSNPRERAPALAPAASAPEPGWSAECAWPRALLELPRRSRRRGVRSPTLRPREARLGASPSKGKATPRAEPRRSFPAASPLKEARTNSRYVLEEGCGAGAVPYGPLIRA